MSDLMQQALATCTPEEKRQLLAELATQIFETCGAESYSIRNTSEQTVGYLTPDLAALLPLDEAHRAEVRRRVANPGRQLTVEQFLREAERAAKSTTQPTA